MEGALNLARVRCGGCWELAGRAGLCLGSGFLPAVSAGGEAGLTWCSSRRVRKSRAARPFIWRVGRGGSGGREGPASQRGARRQASSATAAQRQKVRWELCGYTHPCLGLSPGDGARVQGGLLSPCAVSPTLRSQVSRRRHRGFLDTEPGDAPTNS